MSIDRIVTVRPASLDAFREMLVSQSRGVMMFPTKMELEHGDRVLVDIRLPEMSDSVLLRMRVSFTLPEGRGPFFAVLPADRVQLGYLLDGASRKNARSHARYPARIDAGVYLSDGKRLHAQVNDLSAAGARVAVLGELPIGEKISLSLRNQPEGMPKRISAEVRAETNGMFGLAFTADDPDALRELRWFFRQGESRGELPRLDASKTR